LEPQKDTIEQIGIRTNKGFEKILTITGNTPEERLESQRKAMIEQYEIMRDIDPDVMSGYNSENFDWNFEIEQWKKYGADMKDVTASILREGI
jgi:DNA polymerase elongation subunit (family B)